MFYLNNILYICNYINPQCANTMESYLNLSKEELVERIKELESQNKLLSEQIQKVQSPKAAQQRFKEKYAIDILGALPDMLTVFSHSEILVDLASSEETNHVGQPGEQLIGMHMSEIVPPEAYNNIKQNLIKVIKTGKCSTAHHDLIVDGELHHYENRIFPLDQEYVLIMCRDVTETVKAQEALNKTTKELIAAKIKAEQSDKLKSAFLANMSHEIRTPLNAIVGFAKLLNESESNEERQQYSEIIDNNAGLLLQLINDILDLSKIEAGTLEFINRPTKPIELCKCIYETQQNKTQPGVSLIFEENEEDITLITDPNRLAQVITNLITNAIKFTHEGNIRFGFHRKEDVIEFYVKDTGIGIPHERVEHIFSRFVKLNSFAQGTGLGLAICKMIVEKIGGNIWVESIEGRGSIFHFSVPYTKKNTQEKKDMNEETKTITPHIETNNARKSILIAEDIDSNYLLLKALLGKKYQLYRAHNGIEAIDLFKSESPDIILMDIKMPEMDGLEATEIIRELSLEIPIIALTAFAFDTDKKEALNAGCNDFITKPIAVTELKKVLSKYITE